MIAGSVPDIIFQGIKNWVNYGGKHTLFVNLVGIFAIFLFAWAIITWKLLVFWRRNK